ncbi:MAG: hypothetical protein LM577_06105 [Thermoproteaceae archaeon]|nr:hypothetical protein [Thermoproteaceae archaeon]
MGLAERYLKCLEGVPREPGTAHGCIIEWLVKALEAQRARESGATN